MDSGLMRMIWIIVLSYICVSAENIRKYLQWGSKLDADPHWTIYELSASQCYEQCFTRAFCRTFSYNHVWKMCNLFKFDSTTKNIEAIRGFVMSEKRNWLERYPDDGCVYCTDVCSVSTTVTCEISSCAAPLSLDGLSIIKGNIYTVGSKVKHVCSNGEDNFGEAKCLSNGQWSVTTLNCIVCQQLPSVTGGQFLTPNGNQMGATGNAQCDDPDDIIDVTTSTCQPTAQWSVTSFSCLSRVGSELHGITRKIVNLSTGKFWHNDGNGNKKVSTRWQPNDSFVYFAFFYQSDDGTFKFFDQNWVCDGSATSMASLHTASCPDPEYTKFYIYQDPSTTYYRIISKANNRVVRIDESSYITTISNLSDERSVFRFDP